MIWGAAFSFQSMAMDIMTPLSFTAARMIAATVFLWVFSAVNGRLRGSKARGTGEAVSGDDGGIRKELKHYIAPGALTGFFLFVGTNLQQIGLTLTSVGKSGFLTAIYTILVPVFGFLIFRKKVSLFGWTGAVLALAGVYFLSGAKGLSLAPEDLYLIGCAVAFAFQILFIDLFVKNLDPIKMSAMQFTFCMLFSLLAAFMLEEPGLDMMRSAIVSVLYAGVVSGGIGYTLQMAGQKLSDPAPAAILMSLESVFSALFGVLILGQMMSGREILGSCIMLSAVVIVQLSALRE